METKPCPPVSLPAAAAAHKVQEERSPPAPQVLSILMLLPPDAYALTTAMGREDKETLAFFIARNPDAEDNECHRRASAPGVGYHPSFGCGCFGCYGNYWSRWQSSLVQNLIDQAMEAYDDHMAAAALDGGSPGERRGAREASVERRKKEAEPGMFREMRDLGMGVIELGSSSSSDEDIEAADTSGRSEEGYVVVKRGKAAQASNGGRRRGGGSRFWSR